MKKKQREKSTAGDSLPRPCYRMRKLVHAAKPEKLANHTIESAPGPSSRPISGRSGNVSKQTIDGLV